MICSPSASSSTSTSGHGPEWSPELLRASPADPVGAACKAVAASDYALPFKSRMTILAFCRLSHCGSSGRLLALLVEKSAWATGHYLGSWARIGHELGRSRATVTRAVSALSSAGLISVVYGRGVPRIILNVSALLEAASKAALVVRDNIVAGLRAFRRGLGSLLSSVSRGGSPPRPAAPAASNPVNDDGAFQLGPQKWNEIPVGISSSASRKHSSRFLQPLRGYEKVDLAVASSFASDLERILARVRAHRRS